MIAIHPCAPGEITPWRAGLLAESGGQCVHDALPRRTGWTSCYLLECDGRAAGYGAVAIAGPWQDRPAIFEFHVLPQFRHRAFFLFENFLTASRARHVEVQTSQVLLTAMLHAFGRNIVSEKIVFADGVTTSLPANGTGLCALTPDHDVVTGMEQRAGCAEWSLLLGDEPIGRGQLYFHYNAPYCDVAMEIAEPHRRQGRGSYLVQELKRLAHVLGAVPAARCNTDNLASRATLQRAGFVPCGHILLGEVAMP